MGSCPRETSFWHTARRLHEALAGRTLTRSDFRVPALATADLTGDVVTETVSRGKHLLTRTGNGLTVHTHLRMDGDWRVRPAAEQIRDSHRIRLLLANEDWQAIGYQLGVVELIRTSEESRVTGHLGPDLLGPDWDCAEAVRRLSAEPDRPIGEALLDQRNLAGIGNVYKAELLFLRGLSPWQPVGSVADLARWPNWPGGCSRPTRSATATSPPAACAGRGALGLVPVLPARLTRRRLIRQENGKLVTHAAGLRQIPRSVRSQKAFD